MKTILGAIGLALIAVKVEAKPPKQPEPIVLTVLQEAAHEPIAGQVAVAGVALDRVEDERWPDVARAVVYQPKQFSGLSAPIRRYRQRQISRARYAVRLARRGYRTCGAGIYYFHADYVRPAWDYSKINRRCQVGRHIFYGDAR